MIINIGDVVYLLEVFGDESGVGDLSWYRRDHEGPGYLEGTKYIRHVLF